jgi:hypothetical protein
MPRVVTRDRDASFRTGDVAVRGRTCCDKEGVLLLNFSLLYFIVGIDDMALRQRGGGWSRGRGAATEKTRKHVWQAFPQYLRVGGCVRKNGETREATVSPVLGGGGL